MELHEARELAMQTDYAIEAVGEPINEADAAAFFLEGYGHKVKEKNEALATLQKSCREYIEFLKDEDYHEDYLEDYQNEIFQNAMKWFGGPDIFDKINKLIDLQDARTR